MNRAAHPGGERNREHTKWSPGLIGFYLSCAGVSLGAAIGFGAWKFFDSKAGLVVGLSVSGVSCITCYFALVAARKPPGGAPPSTPQ